MSEILSCIENARPRLQSGTGFGERRGVFVGHACEHVSCPTILRGGHSAAKTERAKRINGRVQMRESELRRTVADAVSRAFNVSITVALMSVHDEFGFGGQRLRRLLRKMNSMTQQLNDGSISFSDMQGALEDDNIIVGFTSDDVKGVLR